MAKKQFKLWVRGFSHASPIYSISEIDNDYSEMGYALVKIIEIDIDEVKAVSQWDAFIKEQKINEREKLVQQLEELEAEL